MNNIEFDLLINNEFLSISKVQSQLKCGFNKAGKIIHFFIDNGMMSSDWSSNKGFRVLKKEF